MRIGIIGLGDMGRLYAITFAEAGYEVCGTDLPSQLEELRRELQSKKVEVLSNGHEVSRKSDFIIYAVEAERIEEVVSQFAQSTKYGAIVGAQTSVKHPEIAAFEKHLPKDTHIVTSHSLHGPGFSTEGQTLVIIRHRSTNEAYQKALAIYAALKSNIIEMDDYKQHDQIVADTQAVTHMGFESMGSAWKNAGLPINETPDWDSGTIFGTGTSGIDKFRESIYKIDELQVRRLGSTVVAQTMNSGVSAYLGGKLGLGNQVTTNSSAEFENNKTKASLVKDVKIRSLKLSITDPSDKTFTFLKSIGCPSIM